MIGGGDGKARDEKNQEDLHLEAGLEMGTIRWQRMLLNKEGGFRKRARRGKGQAGTSRGTDQVIRTE